MTSSPRRLEATSFAPLLSSLSCMRSSAASICSTLTGRLRDFGAPAVHLGVSPVNYRAIAFYERVGFHRVPVDGVVYGMDLAPRS